jgi:serine/threonine-protein kinase
MSARARLRALVAAWLEQTEPLRYRDLAARQDPPFASLTFGAAGIAYALYRAGVALGDDALLARGERWADAASRHAPALPAASLAYGRGGIRFVRVLLAQARGDGARVKARVGEFVRGARPGGPTELLFGRAGQLAGALVLLEATGDQRLRALADRHAGVLLGARAWTRGADRALAHGQAGPFYALLRWARATGSALPAWFWSALDRLALEAGPWLRARESTQKPVLDRTWCNGSAGLALLWAAASTERGARFARLARSAARAGLDSATLAGGDLCCGLAGRAYALLAAGLRPQALALAASAAGQLRGRWPNGLLKGYPGLVCLALDLAHEKTPRGFPLLEA